MHRFVLAFLLLGSSAAAQTMSADDLHTVYAEAAQTHDGFLYTVHMAGYSSEQAARKLWDEMQQPRMRALRMDQILTNVKPRTAYLFAFDPPVREKLVTLFPGQRAGPIRTPRNWVIVELLETRPAPLPSIASVDLPALVAAGALPSAEQLSGDPVLRMRTAANAIRTLEDLGKARADLDVNQPLSTGETLLVRSLLHPSNGLSEELLKRGADPRRCAYRFCPLHLAAFRGDRAIAELMIARGADVLAVSNGTSVLDAAERSKNPEFIAWLRGLIRAKQAAK